MIWHVFLYDLRMHFQVSEPVVCLLWDRSYFLASQFAFSLRFFLLLENPEVRINVIDGLQGASRGST